MTYREAVAWGMGLLCEDPKAVVIGYNCRYGSKAYGTLHHVSPMQVLEMPVGEALMAGYAVGASIAGQLPILFFERQDFMTLAMDALINHAALIERLSHGEYAPHIIVRAVQGGSKPFDCGLQHNKWLVSSLVQHFPCKYYEPLTPAEVLHAYQEALIHRSHHHVVIAERRDLYDIAE